MKKLNEYPFFLDGATGTRLQSLGMPKGACLEKWVLENPKEFRGLQSSYVLAGSNAVLAPTFGANRAALRAHGVHESVGGIVKKLVDISKEAVDGRALIGGDISPTGLQMPPAGTTDFEELVDIFTEQSLALDEAGVDFIFIETQMSLAEARAALIASRGVTDLPVFVSFCTETGKTIYGGDLTAALVSLQDMGIHGFGINCCGNLDLVARLLRNMSEFTELPLIAKPNAGMPVFKDGAAFYAMTPQELADMTPEFVSAGARILGGCCGTNERHIAAMSEAVDNVQIQATQSAPVIKNAYASERRVALMEPDIQIHELDLTDDVIEDAALAQADGAQLLSIRVRCEKELEILIQNQFGISLPICVECPDGELLSRLIRLYNGKPLIL